MPITLSFKRTLLPAGDITDDFAARCDSIVHDAARDVIDYIRAHWSPSAPSLPGKPPAVRTGDLSRSLRLRNVTVTTTTIRYAVYPEIAYGMFLEEGTRKMAARPYLYPALVALRPTFRDKLVSRLMP